jgi:NAD(P)-dependent dehydrogenase (short-subunit alcohol dehydrogenase family)
VVVNGRAKLTVDRTVARIREAVPGAPVKGVAADAGSADGVDARIAAAPDIDILVNNVGIFEVKPFFEIVDADWTRFFAAFLRRRQPSRRRVHSAILINPPRVRSTSPTLKR